MVTASYLVVSLGTNGFDWTALSAFLADAMAEKKTIGLVVLVRPWGSGNLQSGHH
jgi:hypothetical protein